MPTPDNAPTADLIITESEAPTAEDETAFCQHIDAQGRRCRMLVKSPDEALCAYHQRRLQEQRVSESAQELLACGTDFADAPAVNRFLGALVRQVTLKRIPRRDAVTLAYICQLLLNSLGAINREESLRLEEARVQALAASKLPPPASFGIFPGLPMSPLSQLKIFRATSRGMTNKTGAEVNSRNSVYSLPAKRDLIYWNCAIFKSRRPSAGLPFGMKICTGEGVRPAGCQLPTY